MNTRRYEEKIQQDAFWRERIYGFRELSEEKICKRMECLDLHLAGPYYCVNLFASYIMEKDADEIDAVLFRLMRGVKEEYKKKGIDCYTITDTYCNVVSIHSIASDEEYRRMCRVTVGIAGELMRSCDVKMFVGIGEKVDKLSQLNKSKDTAAEALAYKFSFSEKNVITAKDIKKYYNQSDTELKMHYDRIMGCFYDENLELLEIRLKNLFDVVQATSGNSLDGIRNVCIELTATLLRVVREKGVAETPEISGVYTRIAQLGSVGEIRDWFLNYCAGMMQKVGELRKSKTQQILEQAERFIEENLGDPDLSLQTVSEHVGLSAPYFSNIFFQAKDMHINEYINRIRVRQAQKYLLETKDKAAVIARNLGFSSPSYFNNVFKRYTGTTPNSYRESR